MLVETASDVGNERESGKVADWGPEENSLKRECYGNKLKFPSRLVGIKHPKKRRGPRDL